MWGRVSQSCASGPLPVLYLTAASHTACALGCHLHVCVLTEAFKEKWGAGHKVLLLLRVAVLLATAPLCSGKGIWVTAGSRACPQDPSW